MTFLTLPTLARLSAAAVAGACAAASSGILLEPGAKAPYRVGGFASAGLIFRDNVEVEAFPDPKVDGITIYLSTIKRPLTDKLQKDFFTDPSSNSISASRVGPVRLRGAVELGPSGEDVFSAKRSLMFKDVHVRRIYDASAHVFVYVSYSWRIAQDMTESNSRFKTSVSTVPLYDTDIIRNG